MLGADFVHYLDLTEQASRSRIRGLKPGGSVRVLVRSSIDPIASPIDAKGSRNLGGNEFLVEVQTADGVVSHTREWDELMQDLNSWDRHV